MVGAWRWRWRCRRRVENKGVICRLLGVSFYPDVSAGSQRVFEKKVRVLFDWSENPADLTKDTAILSRPAFPQASYEDSLRLSTLALRSLLRLANLSCVFLSQPNVGLIRKASAPENSSDWVRVVDPGSVLLGSKRNECSPTKRPYNDPRQRNSRLEFSYGWMTAVRRMKKKDEWAERGGGEDHMDVRQRLG